MALQTPARSRSRSRRGWRWRRHRGRAACPSRRHGQAVEAADGGKLPRAVPPPGGPLEI